MIYSRISILEFKRDNLTGLMKQKSLKFSGFKWHSSAHVQILFQADTHESITSGFAGLPVSDHHSLLDVPEHFKILPQTGVRRVVRKASHEDLGEGGVFLRRVHHAWKSVCREPFKVTFTWRREVLKEVFVCFLKFFFICVRNSSPFTSGVTYCGSDGGGRVGHLLVCCEGSPVVGACDTETWLRPPGPPRALRLPTAAQLLTATLVSSSKKVF